MGVLGLVIAVVGKCNPYGACNNACCYCYYYDMPDQLDGIPPRRGYCPEFDGGNRRCRIYEIRPQGCRDFPTVGDFVSGNVPSGCEFRLEVKGRAD